MSYTPTNWKSGDVVTSAKLNNIEKGISNATPLFITFDDDTGACDHTWQEIHDALVAGQLVLYREVGIFGADLVSVVAALTGDTYSIYINSADIPLTPYATAESADGYPVMN